MNKFIIDNEILNKYAQVLVNFALGGGKGINEKETVYLGFENDALPLAKEVYKEILKAGSYPIYKMAHQDFQKIKYDIAQDHQLEFFPEKYYKALVDTIDHRMALIADKDPLLLKNVDPKKITKANKYRKKYKKWLDTKEDKGEMTWTLGLFATEGMAKEANLSLKEYWNQIIKACFLDHENPIKKWQQVFVDMNEILQKLNDLPIEKLHLEAEKTDLWITIGESRKWIGGSGRNIPSFEIFTSPDCRETRGHISFDLPLYRYGNIVEDIYLEFEDGKVTKVEAGKNQDLIEEITKQENADRIGEFSLTDKRFSRIDEFMANTLYDENFGGDWGNTHIALGASYHDTFDGDPQGISDTKWEKMGYNDSPEHVDIMATTQRKVTAILEDGSEQMIYKNGEFTI
jgi:aminopeptidase